MRNPFPLAVRRNVLDNGRYWPIVIDWRWSKRWENVKPAPLKDKQLIYAATKRCPCGAGLAYSRKTEMHGFWDCSDILTGRAIPKGQPGSVQHTDRLPFVFYEIKGEQQPSANGATTRPAA